MPEKRLSVVPPEVTVEDLEDFLATDDLFIEYFNHFLQLPTFPEPLFFNKDRGGFEVVSDAKQELKSRLRSVARAQQKRKPIYNAPHQVILEKQPPMMPWHYEQQEEPDLKTSFKVQCLNKDQGIHWIKDERLPAFLQSDCYLEYRLAKLISQTEIASKETDCPLHLYIDPEFKPFAIEKPFVEEEEVVDEKQLAIRRMFVCMGDAITTQTDDWFSQVKLSSETKLTTSSETRPSTAVGMSSIPMSSRPVSELSGRETAMDSGIGSMGRHSSMGEHHSVTFEEDLPNRDHLFKSPIRPRSPPAWRPPIGEDVCVVASGPGSSPFSGGGIYVDDIQEKEEPLESLISRDDADGTESKEREDEEEAESGCDVESQAFGDDQEEELDLPENNTITVHSLENLSLLIVSHAMINVLTTVYNHPVEEVNKYLDDNVLHKSSIKSSELKEDWMERVMLAEDFADANSEEKNVRIELPATEMERSVSKVSMTISSLGGKDQGDTDSLFDSDNEDDSMEPDTFFSRPPPTYDLMTMKGMEAFKKFLWGTAGERCWNLWLDIDKGKNIKDEEIQQIYLSQLREKYLKAGGLCELPAELRDSLGLSIPSHWTSMSKLLQVQPKLTKSLLLYWAPRFLMREAYQCRPGSSYAYHQRRLKTQQKREAYHEPRSITLLPLRPKTCMPRLRGNSVATENPSKHHSQTHKIATKSGKQGLKTRKSLPLLPLSSATTALVPKSPAPVKGDSPQTMGSSVEKRDGASTKTGSQVIKGQGVGQVGKKLTISYSEKIEPIPPDGKGDDGTGEQAETKVEEGQTRSANGHDERKRPVSAAESTSSQESEFLGGRRMESLLDGLYHEKKAGGFFMKYLENLGNQIFINCLNCWHELQEYHTLFFAEVFSPYALARKAQEIHSKFIVEGCYYSIHCSLQIRARIYRTAIPPFEELFDEAEEHIFQVLLAPWSTMKESDKVLYDKIQLTEEERQLEGITSRHLQRLQRRLNRERMMTPDFIYEEEDEEGKRESYYDSLAEKVPQEFKDFDYNKLIHNRLELENFRNFLDDNYALMDLLCWMDIESFRRTPHLDSAKRDQKAKDVKTKYLNKKYFFGPNSPATRKQQNEAMMAGGGWGKLLLDRPPTPILLEIQKYVRERLERKWLPLFLCTEEFQERQRPNMKFSDLMDDLLLNRRKRSQAIYKILESRWVSSSREIIMFRQALSNPFTCQQFRKFVSIKGENLENDVLFWLEVQKFKDMYHNHTEDSLIHQKISAIIRCFIDSEIQPGLHIDITPEQADKIIDKRPKEMGPYVFRDAQLTVFRVLFSHWSDFLKYRNTIADDKILEDLERKKRKQKKKEAEQRRLEEEKEQKAAAPKIEDDRMSISSRRMSRISGMFADFLDEEEEEERIQWKYSDYVKGLEREEQLLNGDDRASSILSSITNLMEDEESTTLEQELEKKQSKGEENGNVKSKAKGKVTFKRSDDSASISAASEAAESQISKTKKKVTLVEPSPSEKQSLNSAGGKNTNKGKVKMLNGSAAGSNNGKDGGKGSGKLTPAPPGKPKGDVITKHGSRPATSKRR
ncbi:Regulator of G-protein signaling 22 [Holothuria leucospilota]|uniref:Regulator of G-protein signaling 22 n=1 Tax=Holothuria leucospilota TaxID=206669 RepID=A0A9Q1H2I6_HOLLE|nr:Regulator of G-protein signaling 22 [Holothuria leucospilota]